LYLLLQQFPWRRAVDNDDISSALLKQFLYGSSDEKDDDGDSAEYGSLLLSIGRIMNQI
jgi:hypothetical protein